MTNSIAVILIALIAILGVVVLVLNHKGIQRDNENTSKITELSDGFNTKYDSMNKNYAAIEKNVNNSLDSLRRNIDANTKTTETSINNLFKKIDTHEKETKAAIEETKDKSTADLADACARLTHYADEKADGAKAYTVEIRDEIVSELENRITALSNVVESLNLESAKLREELSDQRKKLNFYANIEETAESITVREDTEERTKALEAIKEKILSSEKKPEIIAEGEDKKTDNTNVQPTDMNQSSSKDAKPRIEEADGSVEVSDLEEDDDRSLDREQEFARAYMENTSNNIFVTGKAGTGKSFLLDVFRLTTKKANIVLAPTGIAALNVRGATLHSTFGFNNLVTLDVDDIDEKSIWLKSEKRSVLKSVKTIIIDEISMVRADTFEKIDRILKAINNSDLPFGGKQMIVFGDLFQLPPVVKRTEQEYLMDRYGGVYFFHSNAYKEGDFKFIELTENHRQKGDQEFFDILNRIREGKTTVEDINSLNARYTPDESAYDRFTSLFPTKAEAERVNRSHMDQLESTEYLYRAKTVLDKNPDKTKNIESIFPIVETLRLKLGASVMMVANDPGGRWVNGTVGIIKKLTEDSIIVSFGKNRNYEVPPIEFDEQEITYKNGKITYEKTYSVVQYPIVPAYAITIHKSQGQTYENVMCDIEKCFASGQAYVALSRCASLKGLHLKSHVTPGSIKVDHEVIDFYHQQIQKNLLN